MPKILEYNATATEAPATVNAAAENMKASGVLSGAANALDVLGQKVTQHEERLDNTNLALQHSNIDAQAKVQWQTMMQNGDAADPEKVQAYTEKVSQSFDSILDGMNTTRGKDNAERAINQTKNDFAVRIAADHATAQGELAVSNNTAAVANFSIGVAADPQSIDDTMKIYAYTVNNYPGLDTKQKGVLLKQGGQEFMKAAVQGLVERKQFDKARDFLNSGKADSVLDESQQYRLGQIIDQRENAAAAAQRLKEAADERAAKQASDAALNEHINGFSGDNVMDPVTQIDAINKDDRMRPADKGEAIRLMEVENNMRGAPERAARAAATAGREAAAAARAEVERAQVDSDKRAAVGIMARINAPAGDPTRITEAADIYAAVKEGGLTVTRANTLVTAMNTLKTSVLKGDGYAAQYNEFHRAMRQDITHGSAFREGEYADFVNYTEPLIQKGLSQGKTAGQLFDKDSPDYVGKGFKSSPVTMDDLDDKGAKANNPNAPAFAVSSLDKIPKGSAGSTAGIAALNAAVKAGSISPQAATREVDTRGWRPGAK